MHISSFSEISSKESACLIPSGHLPENRPIFWQNSEHLYTNIYKYLLYLKKQNPLPLDRQKLIWQIYVICAICAMLFLTLPIDPNCFKHFGIHVANFHSLRSKKQIEVFKEVVTSCIASRVVGTSLGEQMVGL